MSAPSCSGNERAVEAAVWAERGNDNRGGGAGIGTSILTLDSTGQAVTDFDVSWQPGDNFRIAVILNTPGADTHLNQLHVTNAGRVRYRQDACPAESSRLSG